MATTPSPKIGILIPDVGSLGPQYATDIVNAFLAVDNHDHTETGNQIPVGGLSITTDFDMNTQFVINVQGLQFTEFTGTPGVRSNYVDAAGDFYFNNKNGVPVKITNGNALNVSVAGGINGLDVTNAAGANATYFDSTNGGPLFQFNADTVGGSGRADVNVKEIQFQQSSAIQTLKQKDTYSGGTNNVILPDRGTTLHGEDDEYHTFKHWSPTLSERQVGTTQSRFFFDAGGAPKYVSGASGTEQAFGTGSGNDNANFANFCSFGDFDQIIGGNFSSTGGSRVLILTDSTSPKPLRGLQSILYDTYTSGDTVVCNLDIDIPRGYRNQIGFFSFKYAGGGNLAFKIYDWSTGSKGAEITPDTTNVIPQSPSDGTDFVTFEVTRFITTAITKIRLEWEATGDTPQTDDMVPVDIPFIFDDLVVSSSPFQSNPFVTITGGNNTVSLSKYLSSNDNSATGGSGNTVYTGGATLTEGTDYDDYGAEWIESIVAFSTFNKTSPGVIGAFTRYTITSNANAFDTTRLPVVNFITNTVVLATADLINLTNTGDPYEVTSVTFSGDKLVIVVQSDFGSSAGVGTVTAGTATFGLTVTKTVGFEPVTTDTTNTVINFNETLTSYDEIWYEADIVTVSGDVTITNQKRNGIDSTWISSFDDNSNSGMVTFNYDTAITEFTVPALIDYQQINDSGATQYFQEGNSTSGFILRGRSLVNSITSMITASGHLTVRPGFADSPKLTTNPTGTYVVTPQQAIGTIVDSVLTEVQYNTQDEGHWVLCDGRSILGSDLAGLTSVNFAPNFSGRYAGMSGIAGGAQILVDTFGNFSDGDIITIGGVVLTASSTINTGAIFQYITGNAETAVNIQLAYNRTKEAHFSDATISTATVTIPDGISILTTDSTSAISFPGLALKELNAIQASEVKSADVALTDPGHMHNSNISTTSGSVAGAPIGRNDVGDTYPTTTNTTGITISAGDETRPATFVVNKFIKISLKRP